MRQMRSGRAWANVNRPEAMAECDRTGFWYRRSEMRRQFQWAGNTLEDTGLLVGFDQVDLPQDQFRTPILPPDPFPVLNPRPSPNVTPVPAIVGGPLPTSPDNQGFSVYLLGLVIIAAPTPPPPTPPTPPGTQPSLDFSKEGNSQYIGLV